MGPGKQFLVHRSCFNQRVTDEAVAKVIIDVGDSEGWESGLMCVAIPWAKLGSCVAFEPMPQHSRGFSCKLTRGKQAKVTFKHLARLEKMSKRAL